MKTLKKTLCLVLAVVMVFGLCAVSASADLTYTDNDKITYLEAVDVMSGIGILQGDERGFRPTDDITRAEAAKILAYIMIGDSKQADALKASNDPFTDVPASHWAAGYIAYCATAGVIKGMGDGTYHPGDNVTGLQFATMLLRALGYGQNQEYEGTDWAINASKDALRLGVFEKNPAGASATAKATREECALYAFNMMAGANDYSGIKKVSYSTLLGGYITNSTLVSTGSANAPDANKAATFGGDFDLVFNPDDGDDFGRMAGHSWAVKTKGNVISDSYYDDADLVGEFYCKVTKGEVADILGASFINDVKKYGEYEVWVNGVRTGGYGAANVAKAEIDIDTLTKGNKDNLIGEDDTKKSYNSNTTYTATGNGVETLIYAGIKQDTPTSDPYSWVRIVIVDTYLAKVTSVDKNDNVYVSVLKESESGPVIDGSQLDAAKGGNKIKAEGFKKGDYVLVNIAVDDKAVKSIEKAPTLEDTVSRFQKVNNKVTLTVSGTEYVVVKNAAGDSDVTSGKDSKVTATTMVNGKKHVVYLDKHGYFIAVADIEAASDYVYVSHFGKIDAEGTFDSHALGAKVYYVDGTNKTVTVNTSYDSGPNAFLNVDPDDVNSAFNAAKIGIYKLTMKSGKAVLTDPGTDVLADGTNTITAMTATSGANGLADRQVKRSISTIVNATNGADADANKIKADGKTVFFYVNYTHETTGAGNTLSSPAAKNWSKSDFTVIPYVGINNVRVSKENNATVEKYIAGDDFATKQIAGAVLVLDGLKAETDDTVYLYTGNYDDNGGSKTVTYETYVNGELTDLVITYDSYDDKWDAINSFAAVKDEFFTLTSKNLPEQGTLVEWKNSKDQTEWKRSKEISKSCYEYKLNVDQTDLATDVYTFNAVVKTDTVTVVDPDKTDGSTKPVSVQTAPLSRYGIRYGYGEAVNVIDLTTGKNVSIGSIDELEAALGSKGVTLASDPKSYNGYAISNVVVAVQYANNTSNMVSNIYITSYQADPCK